MGSGVLLAALVVLWFVVLVPMVVTRGDATSGRGEVASSGRTLQRRRAVDPVRSAETERVAIDREKLRSSGELQVDVHAIRRRTLGALVLLALLAGVAGALVSLWAWPAQGLLDLAVVGYVLVLRKAARRERLAARRAARAAARESRLAAVARPIPERRAPAARPAVAEQVEHGTADQQELPSLPHPSLPLAPVHPLRPGRVVAARAAAPAGWQNSAVVGLDDDDIGFADIDEYQPRRVVNG
jgi:Zn-dependent protease with chaperone function